MLFRSVFCEGESEQAYTDFLKKQFQDVAVIKRPSSTGLFDEADALFKNNIKYKNSAEVTDGFSLMWKQRILVNGMIELLL